MIWSYFIVFALLSVALWTTGAWAAWRNRRRLAFAATGLGLAVFFAYILIMWITLERPPLRTMGETRLWYSFFLPLAGIIGTAAGNTSGYWASRPSWRQSSSASISSDPKSIPKR